MQWGKKIRFYVMMEPEQYEQFKALAKENQRSVSAMARWIIAGHMKQNEPPTARGSSARRARESGSE